MTTTYKIYKWFNPRPCTITEGTAMYRDLASKHHPDHRKARFPLVCEPLQILLAPARRHQPPEP